jgi:hypothetical protein
MLSHARLYVMYCQDHYFQTRQLAKGGNIFMNEMKYYYRFLCPRH